MMCDYHNKATENVYYLLTSEELNGIYDITGHVTRMKYNKS